MDGQMEEQTDRRIQKGGWMDKGSSYLFRYGLLTPAIFGVSHLIYRTLALINPATETIKHILAAPLKFNFRRLTI